MKLIAEWRFKLNKLWSVRFAIIGMLLAAADQMLAAFQMFIPPWAYGLLMLLVIVARMVYQPKAENGTAGA